MCCLWSRLGWGLLLVVGVVGCGSDDDDSPSSETGGVGAEGGATTGGASLTGGQATVGGDGNPGGVGGIGGGPWAGAGAAGETAGGAPPLGPLDAYPGPPEAEDTTAIPFDDPCFVGWATGYEDLVLGEESTEEAYQDPETALGPASDITTDVLSLGNSGHVVLTFDPPITNGPGFDLAVFENGFSDTFLELAFVEVSSDGSTFIRFPSAYLGTEAIPTNGGHDTRDIGGLAGKYRRGYGTPFDLESLADHADVQSGAVDLTRITHVRIVDIIGDGSESDSYGNAIYDPYPTHGTAGFDLNGVGVINAGE